MGTANVKAIRNRIKSVDSTKHITKAMELVASSKIRRASERMEKSREYREIMLDAFAELSGEESVYSVKRDESMPCVYIVIAGDRGLAGGYNNNIFRTSMSVLKENDIVIPIGKRALDYYSKRNYRQLPELCCGSVEHFTSIEGAKIADLIKELYDNNQICRVCLISTRFNTMLSQTTETTTLLPLGELADERKSEITVESIRPEYEPSLEEIQAALIREYISGVLCSYVAEAYASELAARRSAMDTATKNADEMLENLNITYNRARQGAITQEITEIVAGANA